MKTYYVFSKTSPVQVSQDPCTLLVRVQVLDGGVADFSPADLARKLREAADYLERYGTRSKKS